MTDRVEQIFKEIHLLFARGEKYGESEEEVIINKKEMFGLLEELNYALLEIMDLYEMNEVKKEQARHKLELEGQKIMDNAERSAEEIYAASIMYTDDALVELKRILRGTKENILHEYNVIADRIDKQIRLLNANKDELNTQLQEMAYGKVYLRLLKEERKRKEKEDAKKKNKSQDAANEDGYEINNNYIEEFQKPEVVINVNQSHPSIIKANEERKAREALEAAEENETETVGGVDIEGIDIEGLAEKITLNIDEDGELPTIHVFNPDELDAEFFDWQEEQEKKEPKEEVKERKSFFDKWKK